MSRPSAQATENSSMLERVSSLAKHLVLPATTTTRSMATSTSSDPRWKQLIGQNIAKAFKEGEKSSVCES